jgi:hypothetical protein
MLDLPSPKDRIKREAMRLFVEHGVDAVSMRDIADAVGMKAPASMPIVLRHAPVSRPWARPGRVCSFAGGGFLARRRESAL